MEIFIILMLTAASFAMGRLTHFSPDKQIEKVQRELELMTASRDRWREKYLVRVMRDKLKELGCKNEEEV